MNISTGDDLYISGFNRDLRDDAISIAKSFTNLSMASSTHHHTKSDSSGSPQSRGGKVAAQDGPIEVCFYRNPTVLSRMILYNKFANANKRCKDHPQDASVWVCAKRKTSPTRVVAPFYGMFDRSLSTRSTSKSGAQQPQNDTNQYSLRQLPIHIACTSLAFAHDTTSRFELEQLIVRLVVTYPEGCAEFDHGGKLPLHEAIWSNASPETTAMLLMASPRSIERRDKFGRTPMELNNRRTGTKNKAEIRDMLLLGVSYWDQARQEAKLRMKLATTPGPSGNKSIDSTSVLAASQIDKETIYTTESAGLPARPKPHTVQIESEEIEEMAWEMLERRVLLLEQLLAEMYEKNYELAGLVQELKKTKQALSAQLEAARAAQQTSAIRSPRSSLGSHRSSLGSSSVAVVPEDDEMSSVKLMEHADRIEQLASLVDSYHDSRRKRRNTGGESKISELSSFTSHTQNGCFVRDRTGLGRQDSLVSGLTDEHSYFDTTKHAVRRHTQEDDDDDDTTPPDLGASGRQKVSEALGTDNLSAMFHKAAELHGSSATFNAEPIPRKEWAPPIAATSFLPTNDIAPMAVEDEDEQDMSAGSIIRMEESKPPATPGEASEIYFPGFHLRPSPAYVNSTISISSSAETETSVAMSENSTSVSDEKEIYFAVSRDSLGTAEAEEEEELISSATMSTRARLEDMVFGSGPDDDHEQAGPDHQPHRYNYDIRIPALDTFYSHSEETGSI